MSDWLGPLPASWSIKRLGALGALVKGRGGSKEDNRDAGVPVVRYGDLYTKFDTTIAEATAFVSEEDAARYTPLPRHSLVFAASGESAEDIGKSAMSLLAEPAVVGGDTVVLYPSDEVDPLYLAYVLQSTAMRSYKAIRSTGFTVVHISAGKLKTLPIPVPPHAEQRAIADYLDRETARIDTLIEGQQRLIEMFRERRNAVITETTTKGLGLKKGLLKPCTGPLWEGLPAGWKVGQVKHAATVTLGKMLQSKDSGGDVRAPYLRAANVQPDGALALDDVNEMWFDPTELEQLSIRAGDVVVVEGGQGGFGRAAYVDEDLSGWGFQNSINRIRPIDGFDGRFIVFYLIALRASGFMRAYSNVVSMPHLTADKLSKIPMPLPRLEEQRAIADYLDRETARIDTLIAEIERFIELAQERRSALITAAVTGQIDVREAA